MNKYTIKSFKRIFPNEEYETFEFDFDNQIDKKCYKLMKLNYLKYSHFELYKKVNKNPIIEYPDKIKEISEGE